MTDLDELVQALRTEHTGSSDRAAATRSRVMMSLHEGKHRRRLRWGFGIPLAAVLAGSTAWAGAGGYLGPSAQAAVESIAIWLGVAEPSPAPASPSTSPARSTDAPPAPFPEDAPEAAPAPEPEPESEPPPDGAAPNTDTAAPPEAPAVEGKPPPPAPPRGASTSTSPSPTPRPAPPKATITSGGPITSEEAIPSEGASAPAEDPHLVHYRRAHDAQFAQSDCAAAVAGYERYLRQAPQGALVPEARFNRALCLVRLGRHDEAERALRPFARGRYGTYRQEDAQRLLDALGAR